MITKSMIKHWVGSDHQNTDEYLQLLVEIANGIYTIDQFKQDVTELWEDTV